MDDIFGLPYQWDDLETQEKLTALSNVAQTTDDRRSALSDQVYSGRFPDDLRDYARFLIHDSGSSSCNLNNYVGRGLTDSATWKAMYQCLHWIRHIDILLELLQLRYN